MPVSKSRSSPRAARLSWPKQVKMFEVGPRDGLQNENYRWTIEQRVELIEKLMLAGLPEIEVGSFVREDLLPQVSGTAEIIKQLKSVRKKLKTKFWAFIPNKVGLEHAIAAGVDGASFFVGVSDTFCQKNVNRTRKELLESLPALIKMAKKNKLQTRVYLSTLVYCPYEGVVAPKEVLKVVEILLAAGASEIVLSDTTGDANPRSLKNVLDLLLARFSVKKFALHLHDTRGMALANVLMAMSCGFFKFDSSVGGMGGCPYAPGASGNLSTEDLANMLLGMGALKDVDLGLLSQAGFFAENVLSKRLPSKTLRTLENKSKCL